VFTGLNRLLAAAVVVGVLLVAPPAALACGGGPSAQNVYKECLPTGGGGKPTTGGGGTPTNGPAGAGGEASSSISNRTAFALKHAGKDRRILATLVHGYGTHRLDGTTAPSSDDMSASALGSAFDLAGPTALLIVLAGTALLLLGGSGMRTWRSRHRA
jgi:hypothetical protein